MVKGADYRGLIISQSSFEAGMEFKKCGYFDLNLANAKRKEVTFFFFSLGRKRTFFLCNQHHTFDSVAGQFTSGVDVIGRQKWGFYLQYLHTRHVASNFDCNPLLMKA